MCGNFTGNCVNEQSIINNHIFLGYLVSSIALQVSFDVNTTFFCCFVRYLENKKCEASCFVFSELVDCDSLWILDVICLWKKQELRWIYKLEQYENTKILPLYMCIYFHSNAYWSIIYNQNMETTPNNYMKKGNGVYIYIGFHPVFKKKMKIVP